MFTLWHPPDRPNRPGADAHVAHGRAVEPAFKYLETHLRKIHWTEPDAVMRLTPEQWLDHHLSRHMFYERRKDRKNFFELLAQASAP